MRFACPFKKRTSRETSELRKFALDEGADVGAVVFEGVFLGVLFCFLREHPSFLLVLEEFFC